MYKFKTNIFIFLSLLILCLSIFYSKDFRIDASSDTLVAQNDSDFEYFNKYNSLFKSENFLVIAVKNTKKINKKFINKFELLSLKILQLENVTDVFSFINAPILFLNKTSLSSLSKDNLETIKNSNFSISDILKEFSNNPIYKDQIINNEANVFSLIIYLQKNLELEKARKDYNNSLIKKNEYLKIKNTSDKKRNILIKNIRIIIKESDNNYQYHLGGVEMIASDVIDFVKTDIIIFSISVTLIIILVLFFIFRQVKWVFICLLSSCYSVIVIFGILGFTQIEITAISSNFSALIFILSISMNIHIINYYRLLDQKSLSRINETITKMFWPCLYTTLTTMVAFGSLIITDIKPIIDFGVIMIISLLISLISSFTILPLFILIFPKNNFLNQNVILSKVKFLTLTTNHYKKIITVSFFLFLLSIIGISKLSVENSFVNYFKKNTEIYKGMKLIDEELGGTTPLDVILTFKNDKNEIILEKDISQEDIFEEDLIFNDELFSEDMFSENLDKVWFTKEKLTAISDIHKYLENRDEIGKVQSIISLIEMANLINKKPLEIFELSVLYQEIPENYKDSLIYPYLLIDKNMAKITARIRDSENINRHELIKDIKSYLQEKKYPTVDKFRVNGLLVLYNNMLDSLFESQIKSLGLVIVLIFLMFIILFKSIKLSVIGIIPNIFASSFILGLIGFLSIPLDIMTITIAAITIGIAVDNTIHYLYRYKEFKKVNKMLESIKLTNSSAGLAVLTTSITIALGFSILSLSSFIPTVLFGIFTSLAMIFAMIGVLIVLPSLLMIIKND